jgi:hypothetical protein
MDTWQNETGLRVTLKGAQLGQIAHLCESIELKGRSTERIHLGAHRLEQYRPGSGDIYAARLGVAAYLGDDRPYIMNTPCL